MGLLYVYYVQMRLKSMHGKSPRVNGVTSFERFIPVTYALLFHLVLLCMNLVTTEDPTILLPRARNVDMRQDASLIGRPFFSLIRLDLINQAS